MRKRYKKDNKLKFILVGIIAVLLLVLFFFLLNPKDYNAPVNFLDTTEIIYEVKTGEDAMTMSNELYNLGLIQNVDYFYNLFLEKEGTVYANSYSLSPSMTSEEIYNVVTSPTSNVVPEKTLLIYEGETVPQVASSVADVLGVEENFVIDYWSDSTNLEMWISEYSVLTDEILNENIMYPLEGYLYPATYSLQDDDTLESITKKILDTTEEKYSVYIGQNYPNDYSFHQVLTLASIVERETILDKDRADVSEVFYNRIEQGIYLQSDITVLYGMGTHKETVTYEDLEYDSPYNTYLYEGLPPSPISSVSVEALDATMNPNDNNYLYFFAKQDTGEIIFSETYEDHLLVAEEYAWEE